MGHVEPDRAAAALTAATDMSDLSFRAASSADIPLLRDLADRVWRPSYANMLAPAQIDYMLGRMYAADVIAAEMARGMRWVVVDETGRPAGYLSLSATPHGDAELHKLYLLPEHQGAGLGQAVLRHALAVSAAAGSRRITLRVNKGNARALRSYARAGFRIADAIVADIGGGFVMDDFILTRPLGPAPLVKICGLSTPETLETAIAAGADQVGLVFFARSPRHVTLDQASDLAVQARRRADVVALVVDASDGEIDAILEAVGPDWLQLHGRETPERVADIRRRTGHPVMKALGIAVPADLAAAEAYTPVADRLLFDAKPPKGAALPGGNGVAFDWTILRDTDRPFMLSGGLSAGTVAEAIRVTTPFAVDVSSGVEATIGRKDPALIRAFVAAAKQPR